MVETILIIIVTVDILSFPCWHHRWFHAPYRADEGFFG